MRTNFPHAALLVALQLGLAAPAAMADDETEAANDVMTSEVHFQFDSAELSPSGRAQLDKAASWIRDNRADLIVVAGYADKVGSEPYNKALAERRAETARRYLLARGVKPEQIRMVAYGEKLSAVMTTGPSKANRRIVLTAVPKGTVVHTRVRRVDVPRPVVVETPVYQPVYLERPAPRPRRLGLEVLAGGGVTGFMSDDTSDATGVGGMWTARVVAGTRSWVGFEAGYVGSMQSIDALGLDSNAVILGNGVEGAVRLNFTRGLRVQPYLFAGLGWTHYAIKNSPVTTASLDATDDILSMPGGLGLSLRFTPRMTFDVRGTVRGAAGDDLFDGTDKRNDGLSNWSTSGQLGFAF